METASSVLQNDKHDESDECKPCGDPIDQSPAPAAPGTTNGCPTRKALVHCLFGGWSEGGSEPSDRHQCRRRRRYAGAQCSDSQRALPEGPAGDLHALEGRAVGGLGALAKEPPGVETEPRASPGFRRTNRASLSKYVRGVRARSDPPFASCGEHKTSATRSPEPPFWDRVMSGSL